MVKTDYFSHFSALLITHVEDFEVIDNYMFATQVNTVSILTQFECTVVVSTLVNLNGSSNVH